MSERKTLAIEFEGVDFSHGEVEVLKNCSFHVHKGEFVALVGPNGSGKTTILRLVMGLSAPRAGRIEIFGATPGQAKSFIGYVPQYMHFDPAFPISVEEVVRMGRLEGFAPGRRDKSAPCCELDRALELTDLAELRNRPYAALSGGQRRRVLVARALASAPELLILDEPTANMDKESEERLYAVLGRMKGSTTILIATHDTAFVSSLTDVVLCVGESSAHRGGVVRHASGLVEHVSSGHYGGAVRQVLHDTDLPDACSCGQDEPGEGEHECEGGRA